MKRFKKIEHEKIKLLVPKFDLRTFSDPPAGDPPPTDPPPADPPKPAKVEFTVEQQAAFDRILGEKLANERKKFETDYQKKLDDAKTEAEKLAKMNADQKAEYERKQREDAITKRESEITRRELRAEALETLADKGLPKTLADILVFDDAESTKTSLESVEKAFRTAVEEEVNKRLRGTPPGGGGSQGGGEKNPFSKEHWNLTEQAKLFTSDPKKYEMFKAQATK